MDKVIKPIAGPKLSHILCKGKNPDVPLIKHRQLAHLAPKLLILQAVSVFMSSLVSGLVG